ncbi:MAG: tRNA lysidine(34) synthetase TilS [Alphaproteobacteria bacterium]|nr:tRNA lysidine(34) synthetase TilS [Alphaproteobacteria bacterium]
MIAKPVMNNETFTQTMRALLPPEGAKPHGEPPRLAVAVSGGGDSMALCLLVHDFVRAQGGEMVALTVDHALRPGSREEAEAAGAQLAARGIRHRILTWEGKKPKTRLQERARIARYRLLKQACREEGMDILCLAHNLEDQAETFWMRLAHGSGLDGLAGMTSSRAEGGLRILRPLLSVPRAELRDYCRAAGVEWAEDPSNENEKFLRVKLRGFEELLAQEGLTPQRLSLVMEKLARARGALQDIARESFMRCVTLHEEGYATLSRSEFAALHREVQRRVLAGAIAACAPPPDYPPGAALDSLLDDMLAEGFSGRTLAGCVFSDAGPREILLTREEAAIAPLSLSAVLQGSAVWDGRFEVSWPDSGGAAAQGLALAPLGEAGVADLRKMLAQAGAGGLEASRRFEALPARVRRGLPAVKDAAKGAENILYIPHLGWVSPEAEPGLKKSLEKLALRHCAAGNPA